MYGQAGQVIYIGKAKNLKNRVNSYFNNNKNSNLKIANLVAEISNIEITVTNNEIEALLLENKLINQLKPKYNVVFRDDKSYPYIFITNEAFPRVSYWRGKDQPKLKQQGTLYGPYPNTKAVKQSLDLIYKTFQVRSCNSIMFRNRSRPCLEYQLKRCSAPCVNFIDLANYQQDLTNVKLFLQAKSKLLLKKLQTELQNAAKNLNYELAAKFRDQINAIKVMQHEQAVSNKQDLDLDVIAISSSPKLICIHVLKVRAGDLLYSRQFFSKNTILSINSDNRDFLEKFILQNYLSNPRSAEVGVTYAANKNFDRHLGGQQQDLTTKILTAIELPNANKLADLLKIKLGCASSGVKLAWQKMAQTSADEALISRVGEYRKQKTSFKLLADLIARRTPIVRISCFDVSHTAGKESIAGCVVFNIFGAETANFRKFNVSPTNPGDDYQALELAIDRYIMQILLQPALAPSILLIDGGKGQLAVAERVLIRYQAELAAKNLTIDLLAIAKGKQRKPGLEKIYLTAAGEELAIRANSQPFKLLQKIRDAAHKFAIGAHRQKRDRVIKIKAKKIIAVKDLTE